MRILVGVAPPYDTLAQLKEELYHYIKTNEIKLVADIIQKVVPDAPRPWHIEGACLHEENEYPLTDLSGPKNAVLSLLNAAVRHRATYQGPGWRSWQDLLVEFGRHSNLQEIRELAAYAHEHSEPTAA